MPHRCAAQLSAVWKPVQAWLVFVMGLLSACAFTKADVICYDGIPKVKRKGWVEFYHGIDKKGHVIGISYRWIYKRDRWGESIDAFPVTIWHPRQKRRIA
ncbi:hypothetical protein ACFL51_02015, partial [Myxococcota bacterium]